MTGLDVLQKIAYRWTLKYEDQAYVLHEIEAGGPEFEKFLKWLDTISYGTEIKAREVKVNTEDESISW